MPDEATPQRTEYREQKRPPHVRCPLLELRDESIHAGSEDPFGILWGLRPAIQSGLGLGWRLASGSGLRVQAGGRLFGVLTWARGAVAGRHGSAIRWRCSHPRRRNSSSRRSEAFPDPASGKMDSGQRRRESGSERSFSMSITPSPWLPARHPPPLTAMERVGLSTAREASRHRSARYEASFDLMSLRVNSTYRAEQVRPSSSVGA